VTGARVADQGITAERSLLGPAMAVKSTFVKSAQSWTGVTVAS